MSKKSRLIDLLLCIFAGFVGAHRYYEGKILTAVIYTFTFGGFLVGYLADVFMCAFGWSVDNFGLPIKNWHPEKATVTENDE